MLRPLRDEAAFCCLLLCDVALSGLRASEEGLPAQARDGVGAGTGTRVALPLLLRSSRPCDALSLVASRLRLRCGPTLLLPLRFMRFHSPQRQQRQ
jgi:hypothetical protein